jgi:tetratricopeptide (TPR) repeat protein
MRYLFIIFITFFTINYSYAQRVNKRIIRIRQELNNFELNKALRNIDDLIKAYPNEPYYKDLKVYTYRQIITRIKYAKEIVDDIDAVDGEVKDTTTVEILDAIDSLERGLYPKVKTPDIIIKPKIVAKDSVSKKKKRRRFNWGDDEFDAPEETASVTIDSSLIKEDFANKEPTNNDTESTDSDSYTKRKNKQSEKAAKRAQEILNGYAQMDAKFYKQRIIDEALQYSLLHEHVDSCNQYLYEYLIDTLAKENISDTLEDVLNNAADALDAKEFEQALILYNEAMQLAPNITATYFKMAEVYFILNEDSLANQYFKTIKLMEPNNSEILYKMGIHFFKNGDYKKAVQYALQAIMIYPHSKYFGLIQACAGKTASDFNSQWIPRKVMPINGKMYNGKLATKDSPWFWYQNAKQKYSQFCNVDCTLKPNDSIPEKYLEVAAWLNMLDSSKNPEEFVFAKQVRKVGFLDCYVLISLFHVELYSQFQHLVTQHPEKVRAYFELLFDWERPRFDKFKKKEPVLDTKKKRKK